MNTSYFYHNSKSPDGRWFSLDEINVEKKYNYELSVEKDLIINLKDEIYDECSIEGEKQLKTLTCFLMIINQNLS